ncbi:MAG: Jag N-terminal domain-containing protein [Clostridia bacterium]|nr:Jag N-terminal domain-containing protein [Clostridia bacterium]
MRQIEISAKTVEQAVTDGLNILGVSESDVKVEIISVGGFFGLKKAKVKLTVVDENGNPIKDKYDLSSVTDEELKSFGVTVDEKPNFNESKKNKDKFKGGDKKKGEKRTDQPKPNGEKPNRDKPKHEKTNNAKPSGEQSKPNGENKAHSQAVEQPKQEKKGKDTEARKDKKDFKVKNQEKKAPESPRPAPLVSETVEPVDENLAKKAKAYLEQLLSKMSVDAKVELKTDNGVIALDLITDDSTVIGHHGEVLDALQTLTKCATVDDDKYIHLVVDCKNYRAKREESLIALAHKKAEKCVRTGKKVILEPMSNAHRKIIHAALTANDKVITRSEGKEPHRYIVILPKRDKEKKD